MMMDTDKRTDPAGTAHCSAYCSGVGARQDRTSPPTEGGGYQEIYRFCEFEKSGALEKADPRLQWLKKIGLNATQQKIAAEIGVDNFLKMWEIMEKEPSCHDPRGNLTLRIRSFKAWGRFERNRFIKALAAERVPVKKIAQEVSGQFGERLRFEWIQKLKIR